MQEKVDSTLNNTAGQDDASMFRAVYRSSIDLGSYCKSIATVATRLGLKSVLDALITIEANPCPTSAVTSLRYHSSNPAFPDLLSFYAFHLRHILGQWLYDYSMAEFGHFNSNILIMASAHARVWKSELLHGVLWYMMLRRNISEVPDVQNMMRTICCDLCPQIPGEVCNGECQADHEGWYHHCFHGIGHGIMLVGLAGQHASAFDNRSACEPVAPLSFGESRNALLKAESTCYSTTAKWDLTYCLTGVYMTYFEYLEPVYSAWSAACISARNVRICRQKCLQFGTNLFPGVPLCLASHSNV